VPLSDKNGIDKKVLLFVCLACILILLAAYYLEHREANDAYSLAGKILHTSRGISSYQFNIHSNISMMGEAFTLLRGNGSVDYSNGRMAVKLNSIGDSFDIMVIGDDAYFRNNDDSWEKKGLDGKIWDTYDQLTQANILLANSTALSMEKTDSSFILTALPDNDALVRETENAGMQLRGDEQLKEYSIKYTIEKDSYRISSIESRIEFIMNVQGLMTPVAINNRVDIYDYDVKLKIETPVI